jgi:hypothetical protein
MQQYWSLESDQSVNTIFVMALHSLQFNCAVNCIKSKYYFSLLSVTPLKVNCMNIFVVALFISGSFDQIILYSTAAQPVARGQNVAVGGT